MSNHDVYPPLRATMLTSTTRPHLHPRQAASLTTDLTDATSTSTTTPLPPSSSTWTPHNRPPNLGAIIGGAVGGLAALAVLIMLGVWVYLRWGVKKGDAKEDQEKGVPEMDEGVERAKGKGVLLQIPKIDERGEVRKMESGRGKTVVGA